MHARDLYALKPSTIRYKRIEYDTVRKAQQNRNNTKPDNTFATEGNQPESRHEAQIKPVMGASISETRLKSERQRPSGGH